MGVVVGGHNEVGGAEIVVGGRKSVEGEITIPRPPSRYLPNT